MSSSRTSGSAGQGPAASHPQQARRKIRGGPFKALKRTFRRRILLGLLCLVSLGAGYLAAQTFGNSWWIAKLDFRTNTQLDAGQLLLHQKMIATLATHHHTLVNAIKKINSGSAIITKRQLERSVSVEMIATPGRASIHLKSFDPDVAKAVLSALNESIQEFQAANLKARSSGDETVARLAKLQSEINELRQAKQEFLKKEGDSDLTRELASIRDSIVALENYLRDDRRKEVAAKEHYKELLRQLDDLKKTAAKDAEYENDDAAIADSVNDNRRRQQRIHELIRDEKEYIESKASLEAKLKERKEREGLIKNGKSLLTALAAQAWGPAELIRLDSEIHVLKAKLQGNQKLESLEDEVRKIDKLIVPRKGKATPLSPIITQMLDKKLDRELVMLGLAQEIDHLQKELDSQKTRLTHLQSLEAQSSDLDKKIANMEKDQTALQAQSTRAEQSTFSLTPLGEPTTDAFADSSNRPAIFATVFLSGSGLSLLAVLLYELVMGVRLPSDVAKSLRIPVRFIAASPAYAAADYRELCRLVRNQGFLAKTILQIQPLHPGDDAKTNQATESLARAFSERGEKALIVELGKTDPAIVGLADMLVAPNEPIDRFVQTTTDAGTSRIIAGRQPLTSEQLADPSLRAALLNALNTFQVVLIQGRGVQATSEVEALGLATDGLVLLSNGNRKIDPVAREALLDISMENLTPRAMVVV